MSRQSASSDRLFVGCIALLTLTNGLWGWEFGQLRSELVAVQAAHVKRSPGADPRALETLLTNVVTTSYGGRIRLDDEPARLLVLFAFTRADCSVCLEELSTLESLRYQRSDTLVYGLMSYAGNEEIEHIRQRFGISFPILRDLSGTHLESLDLPRTPWKVVVDLHDGRILLEDEPSLTDAERQAFFERMKKLRA